MRSPGHESKPEQIQRSGFAGDDRGDGGVKIIFNTKAWNHGLILKENFVTFNHWNA